MARATVEGQGESFADAMQAQCNLMLHQARLAATRGYMLVVHGMNRHAENNDFLFTYMSGGFCGFTEKWNEHHATKVVVVHIMPSVTTTAPGIPSVTKATVLHQEFGFRARIPDLVRYRPIHGALNLLSARAHGPKHARKIEGSGILTRIAVANCLEYHGKDRKALQVFLGILDMPMHRDILLRGR